VKLADARLDRRDGRYERVVEIVEERDAYVDRAERRLLEYELDARGLRFGLAVGEVRRGGEGAPVVEGGLPLYDVGELDYLHDGILIDGRCAVNAGFLHSVSP